MYTVVAKVIQDGKIAGYILTKDYITSQIVSLSEIYQYPISNARIRNGYLVLTNGKTSQLPIKRIHTANKSEVVNTLALRNESAIGSKGNQPKWSGGGYWYKGDSQGHEGLAEVLVSLLLDYTIGINHIKYTPVQLVTDDSVIAGCKCKSMFTQPGQVYVPFTALITQQGIDTGTFYSGKSAKQKIIDTISLFKSIYHIDVSKYILANLYLDQLTLNEDRHLNNLGLIVKADTGELTIPPIFDNGMALASRQTAWRDATTHELIKQIRYLPFGNRQIEALQESYPSFKLRIRYKQFMQCLKRFNTSLYPEITVNKCKHILEIRLSRWRGLLWSDA